MALQRQITLRNVKGSALTYEEMDKNLSSFFYSASLDGASLLLHYTGSSVLNAPYTPSSVIVPLNPLLATITQLTVAGNQVGDIQYRINPSTLGADSSFKWDTVNYRLGVGTPSPEATIHVVGQAGPTAIRLSSTPANKQAYIDLTSGTTLLGSFGKTRTNSLNIYTELPGGITNGSNLITTIGGTPITQASSTGLGIFTDTFGPNNALTVIGVIGVGTDTSGNQGLIGNILNKVSIGSLPTNTATIPGLLIESPKRTGSSGTGGHVVVGINATSAVQNTTFSVVAGGNGSYSTSILTATATGKIGINKPNPVEALDIVGNTTMTGNIIVSGSATIVNIADSLGANSKVLTVNGSGLVQYSNNLMPKGGIIMWGGTILNIPTGWKLCDGNGGTPVNGVTIPDLTERFIVGAGAGSSDVLTYLYDRTGSAYSDYTFAYYGSAVIDRDQKVNTGVYANEANGTYYEYYTNDPARVAANGQPTGSYHMYNTGGNYFYYIDTDGIIQKGNTIDKGIRYSGTTTTPFVQTTVNNNPGQPANWTGDKYYAPIESFSQAYGFYHVYQKKFNLNATVPTGNDLWYWIFDKRHQNYSLVRGTFNGDASIGTAASLAYYKTGNAVGYSYTPFQKHKNPGVPDIDANTGRSITYNARRLQIAGVVYPETSYSVGDKGGFNDVQITNTTMPQHAHIAGKFSSNRGQYDSGGGTYADGLSIMNYTQTSFQAGSDQPHENRPPYYALAFIIYTGS